MKNREFVWMTKRFLVSDVVFCSMEFVVQIQWQRFSKDLWQCLLTYSLNLRSPGSLGLHYGRPLFLSTVFCRHLLTFISPWSFSTSCSHLYLGLPLLLLPSGLLSKIFLSLLPWSILTTWLYNICHCEDAYEHLILYIYILHPLFYALV